MSKFLQLQDHLQISVYLSIRMTSHSSLTRPLFISPPMTAASAADPVTVKERDQYLKSTFNCGPPTLCIVGSVSLINV